MGSDSSGSTFVTPENIIPSCASEKPRAMALHAEDDVRPQRQQPVVINSGHHVNLPWLGKEFLVAAGVLARSPIAGLQQFPPWGRVPA